MTSSTTIPAQLSAVRSAPDGPAQEKPIVLRNRPVTRVTLSDGMVVVLRGPLDRTTAPNVRAALMIERPAGCDDIVVDAGGVTSADGVGLAALLAAETWAVATGGRLRYTRLSPVLAECIGSAGLMSVLPDPDTDPAGHRAESA